MQQIPHLLLGSCDLFEDIPDRVCTSLYRPLDTRLPACRYRGTVIRHDRSAGTISVIGWQRNVTRLQKMDVSLPTVITAVLRRDNTEPLYRVQSVCLDRRFKGSRGILCSAPYLDRVLKAAVEGQVFDASLAKKTRLNATFCFHIVEVLHAMISWFGIVKTDIDRAADDRLFSEEEVIDNIEGDRRQTLCCGAYCINGQPIVPYRLVFDDLFEKIGFSKDAAITCSGPLAYEFSVGDSAPFRSAMTTEGNNLLGIGFQRMLLRCIKIIQTALGYDGREMIAFTNLNPQAFAGLISQMLAVRHFGNNYQYIMHVLSGLQRRGDTPLCIGAALNLAEAKKFFPGFSPGDLKG